MARDPKTAILARRLRLNEQWIVEMEAALEDVEAEIMVAFEEAIHGMQGAQQLITIIRALEARDINSALKALKIHKAFMTPIARAIEQAIDMGAITGIETLPRIPNPDGPGRFIMGYDGEHPRAQRLIRTQAGELIEGILEDQKEGLRKVLTESVARGVNPRQTALEITGRLNKVTGRREGGLLGLNSQQMEYAKSAKEELRNLDSNYLSRSLRDKRFDARFKRAMKKGEKLSAKDVELMSNRYNDRLLKHRGEVIARDQALTGMRAGRHEMHIQLVETGAVENHQVERIWDSSGEDGRTRESHLRMEEKYRANPVKGMDKPYEFPDGSKAMYPGDSSMGAPAEETIMCRCVEVIRINFLKKWEKG